MIFDNKLNVQGGIALTSPSCNKKQTSGLMEKALSVYQTNGGVVKIKKPNGKCDTDYTQKIPEHVSSTMHVFRGEKYRLILRGDPTQRTAKETVIKNTP